MRVHKQACRTDCKVLTAYLDAQLGRLSKNKFFKESLGKMKTEIEGVLNNTQQICQSFPRLLKAQKEIWVVR